MSKKTSGTLPKIARGTSKNKGTTDPILYMDGVHPQHNTMLAYGWIKKGQDNIIKSKTGRQRIDHALFSFTSSAVTF